MWVGYAVRYAVGMYHLINPTTKRCILSRDVICLKKTYGKWAHVKKSLILQVMTSLDDNHKEKVMSPLAEMLVYISDNDLENKPSNDLL